WLRAAEKNERDGGPIELSENALLAAVDAFSAFGDFYQVRVCYERLTRLALADARRERYKRVVTRYGAVREEAIDAPQFPEYMRAQHAYPPIWEWDMVEWELDGDYAAVCASIVGDRKYASMLRRRALQVLLQHLDAARVGGAGLEDPVRLSRIAQALGELQ